METSTIIKGEHFNISLPDPVKKSGGKKMGMESDEENDTASMIAGRMKTVTESISSPSQKFTDHMQVMFKKSPEHKASLSPRSPTHSISELGHHSSRDFAMQRPGLIKRLSRRMDPVSDSDEEPPVPIEIYSPLTPAAEPSSRKFAFRDNDADNSSEGEDVITRLPRRHPRRLRHNRSRRPDV